MKRAFWWAGALGAGLLVGRAAPLAAQTTRPEARVQTAPVPHKGDAADDPAVWIHPNDPGLSLIIGTDKRGALHTYDMDGSERQVLSDAAKPNNVDVLYGFNLAGRTVDLAVAGAQGGSKGSKKKKGRGGGGGRGVRVWTIDAATRGLSDVTGGASIPALGGAPPFGVCGYRSARTGRFYFFVTDEKGRMEQYELNDAGSGRIAGTKVRALGVSSLAEGCVADDELGFLYVAQETVGIWKFGAEPDAGAEGRLVARVGEHGLMADVEGLAIYYATQGRGYLIASSQGNNTYKVYERGGDNRYVLTIDPQDGRIDDVSDTDGIDVTSCPTSRQFGKGLFVVQDGANEGGNQNFKLYAWEDIAGANLLIDTACRRRGAAARGR